MMLRPQKLLVLVFLFLAAPAVATTRWADGDGDWFRAGNWSAGVPDFMTNAEINNGGTARISLGNSASAQNVVLGFDALDSGGLAIDRASSLSINAIYVGYSGSGTLKITNSTVLDGVGWVGAFEHSFGAVTVDRPGSTWTNIGFLSIGEFGVGTLNIVDGGMVSSPFSTVGDQRNSVGIVTVDGAGSRWDNTTQLFVGERGTGTLNITNGGTVSDGSGEVGVVRRISSGSVLVDGAGSTWTNNSYLYVGEDGSGTLRITHGGTVSNTFGIVGVGPGVQGFNFGTGSVIVDGAGSTWTNSTGLIVGDSGTGRLTITNGGVVVSSGGFVGSATGSIGVVTVDGAGSTWNNNGDLHVGSEGNGTLKIIDGGSVLSENGLISGTFLGFNVHASGVVTVDGAGSNWINSGQLFVGNFSGGTLRITNGGTVSDKDGYVGYGGAGRVTIEGTGSTWTNSGQLIVGYRGAAGTLNIINGGAVSSTDGFIGYGFAGDNVGPSGTDMVTVDGPGSTWTNSRNLYVGGSREGAVFPGLLRVENGGTVNASAITIWKDGMVIDDASLVTSSVFVMSQGFLGGKGTVFGNLTNAGIVSPGNSLGTLFVKGNYAQNANGTLRIEIAGLAPAQHDLLQVGTATLDGTLQLVRLSNFNPHAGDTLLILTSTSGSVSNEFATVLDDFGTMITPHVIYQRDDVFVQFVQGLFASLPGLTPNQQAVAGDLDEAARDARATNLIDFLNERFLADLPHDFDLIAPEELASIYEIGFSQANVQLTNLQRRMEDIRAGSNGFSADGYQVRDTHGFTKRADGKAILEKNPAPIMQPASDNRWGIFVTGTGQFVNVGDDDSYARGYDITTGGFTLGLDYRPCPGFAIGLDAGYARSNADLVNRGQVTVDGGKFGVYATWFGGGFYLDGAVSGGYNSYDTRRSALLGQARGSTNGAEFNGLVGGGYDWKSGGWSFGPVATFQYSYVSFDGFTEDGSLAPLAFPDQSEDSERSAVGLKASYDWKVGGAIVRHEVRTVWQHEFGDKAYPIDSRFASGAGGIFTVHGPEIGRDSALIDAGFAVLWNERVSTYLYYDGQLGRANYTSHGISGDLRVSF